MCNFFSLISNGKGKPYYFDSKIRRKIIKGKLGYETDSHTSIADHFGFKGAKEDKMNKYEYNPITNQFKIDQLNTKDDSEIIKRFCEKLDFKAIVPELIIHPIVHPFNDIKPPKEILNKHLRLLKHWDSVWASVGDSVWASVWASVRDSVWDSVRDSVWDSVRASVGASVRASVWASVRASVRASVWASVRDSVRDSVWDSVGDSVRDSVGAYESSFYNLKKWKHIKHPKGKNPFQPCIDLWNMGLVPGFDGEQWYLFGDKKAKILWKGKI